MCAPKCKIAPDCWTAESTQQDRHTGIDGHTVADQPGKAKILLIFAGTLVHFLMPGGVLFQSVAMFSWSSVIVRSQGLRRAVGMPGLIAAPTLIVALIATSATAVTHVFLGGIVLQAIWYASLAALLFQRRLCPDTIEPPLGDRR